MLDCVFAENQLRDGSCSQNTQAQLSRYRFLIYLRRFQSFTWKQGKKERYIEKKCHKKSTNIERASERVCACIYLFWCCINKTMSRLTDWLTAGSHMWCFRDPFHTNHTYKYIQYSRTQFNGKQFWGNTHLHTVQCTLSIMYGWVFIMILTRDIFFIASFSFECL